MDMALMTDIRYAARSARFAESYIKVGLVPGDGGAFLLPRLVGLTKALELFDRDFVNAEEAERLGIVSKVCDDDALMADITAWPSAWPPAPASPSAS
ncbi:MAG: enoyl-CoA hydratase-related protein [Acidimicrobiales bacterium]